MSSFVHGVAWFLLTMFIVIGHVSYQIMLRQMRKWNLPVDEKSPGMGFEQNMRTYLAATKNGVHKKGYAFWIAIITPFLCIASGLCIFFYK